MIETFALQGKVDRARVGMGMPRFSHQDIPVIAEDQQKGRGEVDIMPTIDYPVAVAGKELALSFVSMGNPHAVYFVSHPVDTFPLLEVGPQVEKHSMFPKRINFEIARVVDRSRIEARVWELGAGVTVSCGSGAATIVAIATLRGYVHAGSDIMLPGGNLTVSWDGVGEVYLTGPVEEVFIGEWRK